MNDFKSHHFSTVIQAVKWATQQLDSLAIPSSRVESEILLGEVCASSRLDLYLMYDRPLDQLESTRFSEMVNRRMCGEPVQYLTGTTEFYGREYLVTPDVLIPRPETELIVDHVRPFLENRLSENLVESEEPVDLMETGEMCLDHRVRFADIGTGSGVLAITLALEHPVIQGYATDISEAALSVACKNSQNLLANDCRLNFLQSSLLSSLKRGSKNGLDLIVSNPPYLTTRELNSLPGEIRQFEPRIALDGGENGMACYHGLIDQAPECLQKGGMIVMEIAPEQSEAVNRLMIDRGVYGNIQIVKDYNGLERIVSATYAG